MTNVKPDDVELGQRAVGTSTRIERYLVVRNIALCLIIRLALMCLDICIAPTTYAPLQGVQDLLYSELDKTRCTCWRRRRQLFKRSFASTHCGLRVSLLILRSKVNSAGGSCRIIRRISCSIPSSGWSSSLSVSYTHLTLPTKRIV